MNNVCIILFDLYILLRLEEEELAFIGCMLSKRFFFILFLLLFTKQYLHAQGQMALNKPPKFVYTRTRFISLFYTNE